MIDKDGNKVTFSDIVRQAFKCKSMAFDKFEFYYWEHRGISGKLERIDILDFSNNGLEDGKYGLLTDTAQISSIDKGSFEILNFCVSAIFTKNNWTDIRHKFDDLDYWHQTDQDDDKYFEKREKIINKNIKESLKMLYMFFNMFKNKQHH